MSTPTMGGMSLRSMVKQYLGQLKGRHATFNVYESGEQGWVVFKPLDPNGCESTLSIEVKRSQLKYPLPRP